MLIDRMPTVDYNDLVIDYWPEFGKYGKESITIDMLLAHQVYI
jgi:CubicO group peptidase (beta-lactamase class C family)